MICVRLPDNTTRGVPAWMFDEALCANVRPADKPLIGWQALLNLSCLLECCQPVGRSAPHEFTSAIKPGAASSPAAAASASATAQQHLAGPGHARRRPAKVRGIVHGTAAFRGPRKQPSKH
jgi:hypothetical protein